ncbi:MAG: acetyl-CoA carboxylase carboxyltransferase subunit alpha [Deltaproteobacteria bacterium]|nr:acetyl-CoA carboxylase carboxyltransferase subunit alpha [Deltaproteobacteria bacterium]
MSQQSTPIALEFERPLIELRCRIEDLRAIQAENGVDLGTSISQLEVQADRLQERIFTNLSAWQRTQLARHPLRPYTLDFIRGLCTDWTELSGDRAGYEDRAVVGGLARFRGVPVLVVGHQKGRTTKENLDRNFGMARPDGLRKVLRLVKLAEDFGLPVLAFIDTPGAYPGVDAEERGQAEAIARSIQTFARLHVPVISVVVGEGGSGGALALGVANRVLMMENAVYSVISPEGCAAILWRDRADAPKAAAALRITAPDCLQLGVADEIIPEPPGGAHRDPTEAVALVGDAIARHLAELSPLTPPDLRADRRARFRHLAQYGSVSKETPHE